MSLKVFWNVARGRFMIYQWACWIISLTKCQIICMLYIDWTEKTDVFRFHFIVLYSFYWEPIRTEPKESVNCIKCQSVSENKQLTVTCISFIYRTVAGWSHRSAHLDSYRCINQPSVWEFAASCSITLYLSESPRQLGTTSAAGA